MNTNHLLAILILCIPLGIVIFALMSIGKSKDRTAKIFAEVTPIVENAKTLREVYEAWKLLKESCLDKNGHSKIDIAWHTQYIILDTICHTKYKMLKVK